MDARSPRIVGALWGGWLGLACAVLYSVGGLVIDLRTVGLNWGTLMAFGALVGMPLILASAGFMMGWLWTVVARLFR